MSFWAFGYSFAVRPRAKMKKPSSFIKSCKNTALFTFQNMKGIKRQEIHHTVGQHVFR
jgi:hypothetical protein